MQWTSFTDFSLRPHALEEKREKKEKRDLQWTVVIILRATSLIQAFYSYIFRHRIQRTSSHPCVEYIHTKIQDLNVLSSMNVLFSKKSNFLFIKEKQGDPRSVQEVNIYRSLC